MTAKRIRKERKGHRGTRGGEVKDAMKGKGGSYVQAIVHLPLPARSDLLTVGTPNCIGTMVSFVVFTKATSLVRRQGC